MKYKIYDDVWFKDQDKEEEPYYIIQIFTDEETRDLVYIAIDCNSCYVIGREEDFTKANIKGAER